MFHGFSGLSSLMLMHAPCHAGGSVQGLVWWVGGWLGCFLFPW